MGLSYHYSISAPGEKTAATLKCFLDTVESAAKNMGFSPTMVLDAQFDTDERRSFARRLTRGLIVEDEKLKGVVLLPKQKIWDHNQVAGYCRVIPERGVALIVTDEAKCESVFGFFQYPSTISDIHNRPLVNTATGGRWVFSDFIDSPDPRYRQIMKMFADAGYVQSEKDEFAGCRLPPRPS